MKKGLVVDPEVKVSVRRQLREFQEEGRRQKRGIINRENR